MDPIPEVDAPREKAENSKSGFIKGKEEASDVLASPKRTNHKESMAKPDRQRQNTADAEMPTRTFQAEMTMEEEDSDEVPQSNGIEEEGVEGEVGDEEGPLPRDREAKTAYYDYTVEKQMTQADSKLFYQRNKLEGQKSGGSSWENFAQPYPTTPKSRSLSYSLGHSQDEFALSGSVHSIQSNHRFSIGSPSLDKPRETDSLPREMSNLELDQATTPHTTRPSTSHEQRQSYERETLNGAMPAFPSGTGAYANNVGGMAAELSAISTNIQKVLDIRHKYMRLSLQGPDDNPKDDPSWKIYPEPPEPEWDDENNRPTANKSERENNATAFSTAETPETAEPQKRKRKAGQDIGEDFDMSDLLPLPGIDEMSFKLDDHSVFQIYENSKAEELDQRFISVPSLREFYMDLEEILHVSSDGPSKSFAFRRLKYLESMFQLYVNINEYQETLDSKRVPHRDFYNVRKVDTHVHHSACMNQKHLLRFIKSKMKKCPEEVVMFRDEKYLTLEEVFKSINLTAYDLSIDTLDMHVILPSTSLMTVTNSA